MRRNGPEAEIGEAAAARVAESLGFGRVESTGHDRRREHHQKAVLDYIIGNTHSDFVERVSGVPLDDEVVAAVRAIAVQTLWVGLLSAGLPASVAAAALVRLTEVAERGTITGELRLE
ncbi:hypothetical protein ACFQZZ_29450 [Nocardia sp. GCM10030253]|uniref:hypothetical protein n=1 Tax=Nocardia sp. GCM10030253 TaxID=3273404 RepID=UPI00363F507C